MTAYETGTLLGFLLIGLLLGGFTLQQGKKLGQEALGWGGLAACVVGAFVGSILVAGPMALLFNWLIRRAASKASNAAPAWPEAGPESVRR
jgi:hypothetical protein